MSIVKTGFSVRVFASFFLEELLLRHTVSLNQTMVVEREILKVLVEIRLCHR